MQIETFEQTEIVDNKIEADEESMKLIEELGLEGQQNLIGGDEEDEDRERVPYREMNRIERLVYDILYPSHTKFTSYQKSMIPLRVLQVGAHAVSLKFYEEVQVWSEEGQPKDPLLVGKIEYGKYHILARWGEALEPFENLMEKAKVILKKTWEIDYHEKIAECKKFMDSIDGQIEKYFSGKHTYTPF